jgi:lysophospholipase L1-like esterase
MITTRHQVSHCGCRTSPNAGDHSGDVAGNLFTEEIESYLVVKAVEVHGRVRGTVMVTGGSVTDGHGSRRSGTLGTGPQAPPNSRWSDVLAGRFLKESPTSDQLAVANAGIGGNAASRNCGALAGLSFGDEFANVEDRYDRDVLGLAGVTHVVIYAGTNDIGIGTGCPAEEIIAAFTRLVERAHEQGVQVMIATITPRTSYTALQNRERFEVNAWLRRGGDCSDLCDEIVDFDSVIAWYVNPNSINPEYDSGDGIHPNAEGYRAMAQAFDLAEF